jgi:sugar O-acyltransferase (sialic acid O-acetyltransferase NeuD family)
MSEHAAATGGSGLLILGFGGHGRSVADVALAAGFTSLRFVDAAARPGEQFLSFDVVREMGTLPTDWKWIAAAGEHVRRSAQLADPHLDPARLASVVSPHAHVSSAATIGRGTFVGHFVQVGPRASVGAGCILNNGAIVEHDCIVGDLTHVSVNATVAGATRIGARVFVGAGAVVIDSISVADDIVIGAGATVVHDLGEAGVYAGTPARRL